MVPAALLFVLLLAPEEAHEIKYSFTEKMSYQDESSRTMKMELYSGGKRVKFDYASRYVMQHTVLEVDHGKLVAERVKVDVLTVTILASPTEPEGKKAGKSQGRTFVWRKIRDKGWRLFDEEGDVTLKYPHVVERLTSSRDARLPKKPIVVGGSWKVPAKDFLEAAGQKVPPEVAGAAVFTLEEIKNGVAKIVYEFKYSYRERGRVLAGTQKGTWLFDLKRGRDLSFDMKGTLDVDNSKEGLGIFTRRRTVTYR